MCTTCGCSGHTEIEHKHADPADKLQSESLDTRLIEVERNLLEKNDQFADMNRQHFAAHGVSAFNLVSSPGAGKTTLLVKTIEALREEAGVMVIEGDQQTDQDAKRILETGAPAIQINTGKGCHLEAQAIDLAFKQLPHADGGYLFIENVGNLVCPAAFDLGEQAKVLLLSVTEGEDKPIKYPDMFRASDCLLITKTDLLPYLDFDLDRCLEYARRINPQIEVFLVSTKTGEGFNDWLNWLKAWQTRRTESANQESRQSA